MKNLIGPLADECGEDAIGNRFFTFYGDPSKPKVMVLGHADTIGFMVRYIDDDGFVFTRDLTPHDQFDYRSLPGMSVWVMSRKQDDTLVPGHFVPVTPVHHESSLDDSINRYDLPIDIGCSSAAAAKRKISIGDYIILRSEPEVRGANQIVSANLDNRVGSFLLYEIAKALKAEKRSKKATVVLVSSVSEEVGTGPAGAATARVQPDYALTLDVTIATDTMRWDEEGEIAKQFGKVKLNNGPVLMRGMACSDDMFLELEQLCASARIPYQVDLADGGADNDFVYTAARGTRTALIMVPVRNCHTRVETVDVRDIDKTVRLCVRYIHTLDRKY
jgi:endoglucanase